MKRLLRNRKAVSPVVSAVIMILIATIGMSVLFAFFVNYARDFQAGSGSSVLESMVIEDIWVKNSSNVEIWVYNVGKVDFNITSVYINGFQVANVTNPTEPSVETSFQARVEVGKHERLILNLRDPVNVNGPNLFKLVTLRGSAVEVRY